MYAKIEITQDEDNKDIYDIRVTRGLAENQRILYSEFDKNTEVFTGDDLNTSLKNCILYEIKNE